MSGCDDVVLNGGYSVFESAGYDIDTVQNGGGAVYENAGYDTVHHGGYTVFENAGYEKLVLDACVQLLPELEPEAVRRCMALAFVDCGAKSSHVWVRVAGFCIGFVQVAAGVTVLVVSGGSAATAAGALIGGGTSCALYSITAGEEFEWKEFAKNLVVGAAAGAVGAGAGFQVAEAIGEGAIGAMLTGVVVGAAGGAAAGAAGSAAKQVLDLADGATDRLDLVDVVLCAAKGALIGGVVGGVSVRMGVAGKTPATKTEVATKTQALIRLAKQMSVGGAAGGGSQMLENAFRGDPAFEKVVDGLVIGAVVAGTMYLLQDGVKLSMRRTEGGQPNAVTLEEEAKQALVHAKRALALEEQRLANRQRIRVHFEDQAGRRVPDSTLRNTQFRPDHVHAQIVKPDLVLDGVEYFQVGYRGMSKDAYEAAVRNGNAPVDAGGTGGAVFGQGLYVADTYYDAQSYAFQSENPDIQAARKLHDGLRHRNLVNRQKWEAQFVHEGSVRTDDSLRRNQQARSWRDFFQGKGGVAIREDGLLRRPQFQREGASLNALQAPKVTPALKDAVVCDVFLPRQQLELSYQELRGAKYDPRVHGAVDVLYVDCDEPQTRIAPRATRHVRMFPTKQHNARVSYQEGDC